MQQKSSELFLEPREVLCHHFTDLVLTGHPVNGVGVSVKSRGKLCNLDPDETKLIMSNRNFIFSRYETCPPQESHPISSLQRTVLYGTVYTTPRLMSV